jgi:hypothetical protein
MVVWGAQFVSQRMVAFAAWPLESLRQARTIWDAFLRALSRVSGCFAGGVVDVQMLCAFES